MFSDGRSRTAATDGRHDPNGSRHAWAEAVTAAWGYCGVMAVNDGSVIGYLTLAPASLVPSGGIPFRTGASPDAAVMMSAHVVEGYRGNGVGRQMMQTAAGMVARRGVRAIEAVGANRSGALLLPPTAWLESVGFVVVRPHPLTPRLRMDLQATVRWRADLSAAWSRLTGLVPQPAPPEPASFGAPQVAARRVLARTVLGGRRGC
jgi:GNAT superfamily N-acetyltransferase